MILEGEAVTSKPRSFEELADYARMRAQRSCARNDPIAWAYWIETARWADAMIQRFPRRSPVEIAEEVLEGTRALVDWERAHENPRAAAVAHSRMKWCSAILRANGVRPPRLSLDWMRGAMSREPLPKGCGAPR